MSTEKAAKRIIVSNISPNTSEEVISDFFGFCGSIADLKLVVASPTEKIAYITFEYPLAAQTSLILSNAMIEERYLQVKIDDSDCQQKLIFVNLEHTESPSSSEHPASPDSSTSRPPGNAEDSREPDVATEPDRPPRNNATSAIAAIIAAEYKLNDDALAQAQALDARFGLYRTINMGWLGTKEKLRELDQLFKISEKAKIIAQQLGGAFNDLNLAEKTSKITANMDQFWQQVLTKSRDTWDTTLKKSGDWIQETAPEVVQGFERTTASIRGTVQNIKEESNEIYAQNKA